MQIERDTCGKLQCHPYPQDYVDSSKQCAHCSFFMGLQRKQGETIQEGQQFDIRQTVDEFRHQIISYLYWKPGMEIYVSHVRRKQIPAYVFPEGYRRSRHSRSMNQQQVDKISSEDNLASRPGSAERILKRKELDGSTLATNAEKRVSISPHRPVSVSPELNYSREGNCKPIVPLDEMTEEMVPGILKETSTRSNENELQVVDRYKEIYAESNQGAENSDPSSVSPSSNTHHASGDGGNPEIDNEGSSVGRSPEANAQLLLDSGCKNGDVLEDGMLEKLEVLDISSLCHSLRDINYYAVYTCMCVKW